MQPVSQDTLDALEKVIDLHRLDKVLEALADICEAKEQHVQSNWQDQHLAKCWRQCSPRLNKVAEAIRKIFHDAA